MKTLIASLVVLASLAGAVQAAPADYPAWAVKAFTPSN